MRATRHVDVTLPEEMAALVTAMVRSGEYASESEVIQEGLRALQARDRGVRDWLVRDVAPIYDAMMRDPSRARSADDVRAALEAEDERALERP